MGTGAAEVGRVQEHVTELVDREEVERIVLPGLGDRRLDHLPPETGVGDDPPGTLEAPHVGGIERPGVDRRVEDRRGPASPPSPHGGNLFQQKTPAAAYVGNGFGKAAGGDQPGRQETAPPKATSAGKDAPATATEPAAPSGIRLRWYSLRQRESQPSETRLKLEWNIAAALSNQPAGEVIAFKKR